MQYLLRLPLWLFTNFDDCTCLVVSESESFAMERPHPGDTPSQ